MTVIGPDQEVSSQCLKPEKPAYIVSLTHLFFFLNFGWLSHLCKWWTTATLIHSLIETKEYTFYLYSRVIFIYKVVLDELDGESAFSNASSSDHHQLIFRHSSPGWSTAQKKLQLTTIHIYTHVIILRSFKIPPFPKVGCPS